MTGSQSRRDAERRIYERFFYPNTDVLLNLGDCRNQTELQAFETLSVDQRHKTLPPLDPTSYADFKSAHRHLFGGVYPWAGEERPYTTGRAAAPFCRPEYIAQEGEALFARIAADPELVSSLPIPQPSPAPRRSTSET